MAALKPFPITGFATIEGKRLNDMVAVLNGSTGFGTGTPPNSTANNESIVGTFTTTPVRVAAAGASQGTATAMPATAFVVMVSATASTEGVKLPTAVTGKQYKVVASPTVGNKIYGGAAGQLIGANTTATTAQVLAKNTSVLFIAYDATHWRIG